MKRLTPALAATALTASLALAGCTDLAPSFVAEETPTHAAASGTASGADTSEPATSDNPYERVGSGSGADDVLDNRQLSDGTAYEWDGELINYPAEWAAFLASLPSRDALDVLDGIDVYGLDPARGYDREEFGERWVDVDGNGCSTRNDILARDLDNVQYTSKRKKCKVKSGDFHDPYSGKQIHFNSDDSTAVQIDHIVALFNAWKTGAQDMSEIDRVALANDPYNLVAVDGDTNYEKSDGDASEWLPYDDDFRCEYMARQIGVKARYNLWVTKKEKAALKSTISKECPGLELPAFDEIR